MVKRVILGRTGEEKIVDLITAINDKVSAGHTRPAGDKVLDWDEDFYWSRPDGTEHSVRDIDGELEGAKGRIEDAEQSLADSQVRLDEAEQTIASTAEDLTRVETVVIPAAEARLEAADQAAQQELATLDGKLATAQQDLVAVGENIGQLETDLATESGAREQLAQEVQGTFTELDTRLGAFATDEALAPIRQALTNAQDAVETAQGVAQAANQAANAASQAALEAAGIAASKGRVIIQETEPVGEDRNAANIWIKPIPDDPNTEIEEKAITYVYLEGSNEWVPTSSDELAQAAQNALDAREAAQQAQQRADTAISNAAAAQSAAEAAQRTADQATTDARDAWNEAIAAQERLDGVWASAARSFYWAGDRADVFSSMSPSHEIVAVPDAPASGSVLRKTGESYNSTTVYWDANPLPFDPRALYRITFMVRVSEVATNISDPLFYAGVHAWNAVDGAPGWRIATNGAGSMSSAHHFAASASRPGPEDGWVTVTGYFRGHTPDGEVAGGLHSNMADPGYMHPEARYFSPMALIDYNRGDGVWEIGMVAVDVVPAELAAEAIAAQAAAQAAQERADEAMTEASEAKGLAEEAVREVGDTVRNTVIEYAVNTSETVAPTSGWSTSTPTRTPGSFVWMRTIVTYADGDTSTTSPALLTGNAGAKGDKGATGAKGDRGSDGVAGKDGVGLSSTALAYALSTSGTTAPSSGWTANPPTPVKGRYLWTRTIWTYTDSSKETGYSVAYLATDGAKGNDGVAGKDGVGIKSTAITYAASSSGTTAPSSGWSSQPPAASAGQYVWTRTIWTYTDNSTETGYSVGKIGNTGSTGAKGDKGDKGATGSTGPQGVSVSSVTPFFRVVSRSSGAPAQPSGMTPSGWVTVEPAWNPSNKLYRAERIVYSNGTVSWTVPTLVAAYEGIVQVQTSVNGKNSITRSTSNASGRGVVAGDAWYKVDGNGDTMAMWIWSGSAWVASKVRNEMIDTIDVNKLKVHDNLQVIGDAVINKIWADGIAAKAITASSLTIAPGNLLHDGGFERGGEGWDLNGSSVVVVSDPPAGGSRVLRTNPTTGGGQHSWARPLVGGPHVLGGLEGIDVEPGERFRLTASIRLVSGTASSGRYGIRGCNSIDTGTRSWPFNVSASSDELASGEWVDIEGTFFMESGKNKFGIQLFGSGDLSGAVLEYDNIRLVRMVGAVTIEDGAIGADQIRAEEVGAEVGDFVEAEVGNLKATKGTIGEAVINKIWADGIAAKAATFGKVTVASGNLLPDLGAAIAAGTHHDLGYWRNFGIRTNDASFWAQGATTQYLEVPVVLKKGVRYRFEVNARTDSPNSRFYWQLVQGTMDAPGSSTVVLDDPAGMATASYAAMSNAQIPGSAFTPFWAEGTAPEDMIVWSRFHANFGQGASSTYSWFQNPTIRPMAGATLIEPGAVTTEKLKVTGDMSAAIVNAMTTNTKKLVVTKEAILNHATLIGKTVVDDINVQGKLIGKNGVFTGTVDFANINVTGEAIIDTLQGKTISGVTLRMGSANSSQEVVIRDNVNFGQPGIEFNTGLPGATRPPMILGYGNPESDADFLRGAVTIRSAYGLSNGNSQLSVAPGSIAMDRYNSSETWKSSVTATTSHARLIRTNKNTNEMWFTQVSQGSVALGYNSPRANYTMTIDDTGPAFRRWGADVSSVVAPLAPEIVPFDTNFAWDVGSSPTVGIIVTHTLSGRHCRARLRLRRTAPTFYVTSSFQEFGGRPIPASLRTSGSDYINVRFPASGNEVGVLYINYATSVMMLRTSGPNVNIAEGAYMYVSLEWFIPN